MRRLDVEKYLNYLVALLFLIGGGFAGMATLLILGLGKPDYNPANVQVSLVLGLGLIVLGIGIKQLDKIKQLNKIKWLNKS